MLFKVSFKDSPKNPSKAVVVTGKRTVVLLSGTVKFPKFWKHVPNEIIEWMTDQGHLISGDEDIATNTFHLKAMGKARCHEEEEFDYKFGERLAEARAKLKIYKFFYNLCDKLYEYYSKILFGPRGVVDFGEGSCIGRDLKKYEDLYIKEARHIGELLKDKSNG